MGANGNTKWDETRVVKLLDLIRLGMPVSHACAAVKISKQTFYNWKNDSKDEIGGFDSRVRDAESDFMNKHIDFIYQAAKGTLETDEKGKRTGRPGDWRASAWILEKRFPKEFGHLARFEMSGGVKANLGFDDTELTDLVKRTLERNEGKKGNGKKAKKS
ncbi:MAG: hypothetical protein V3U84_07585 [Thiotrichaceae bacterium]